MLKNLCNIPSNAILVTAYVACPYPSMPHDADLQALFDLQSCECRRNDRQKNPIYWLSWNGWIYIEKPFVWIWN